MTGLLLLAIKASVCQSQAHLVTAVVRSPLDLKCFKKSLLVFVKLLSTAIRVWSRGLVAGNINLTQTLIHHSASHHLANQAIALQSLQLALTS